MKKVKVITDLDQVALDITAPEQGVQIRIRKDKTVMWVDVDGVNVLRICRIPKGALYLDK